MAVKLGYRARPKCGECSNKRPISLYKNSTGNYSMDVMNDDLSKLDGLMKSEDFFKCPQDIRDVRDMLKGVLTEEEENEISEAARISAERLIRAFPAKKN